MSDTSSPATLSTAVLERHRQHFENAWRLWCPGQEPPPWQQFLPAVGEPCSPDVISLLLHLDIEYRVKAGLPALLAERYFEHPRLQYEDARLDAERQVELIHSEYQQRWKNGQRARRLHYEAAFPQHADALHALQPRLHCPRCRKMLVLEETLQTLSCPDCGSESHLLGTSPPFVAPTAPPAAPTTELDLRGYELMEMLGGGGMGEVYRCCDPALGRDLAIKVMKADLRGHPQSEQRFLREACVTGSLQHPGIVPVHNLGRLADGRLHYTMRLVRGRTFADILREEAGQPERLPYLLGIFEKICQAVAYAHSKRVIHRDLKPANVMVGRFGEVQVMDWGLAKVLASEDASLASEETTDAAGTRIPTESRDTPADLSRMGSGMGTPAYMPPEQALGEWETVDERADVFALGSILCEMLTGEPAYSGGNGDERLRRARRGDMTEAQARLQQCGADAALTALCRSCLSLEREGRPRDAGAVAKHVADYQAEVQERLRRAELERVAAETRARGEQARAAVEHERTREALGRVVAERRAKRRTLALAAALMLLVVGVAGGIEWQQWKQERIDQSVYNALAQVELLEKQALAEPLQRDKFSQALDAARAAAQLADSASADARRRAEELVTRLQLEEEAARRDRGLLATLLEVPGPHEGPRFVRGDKRMMMALAEPTAEDQFVLAFRDWGLEVDAVSTAEAAARLKARPPAVITEVIAALDEWASQRQRAGKPEAARRLAELATALDDDPGSLRRELRAIMARGRLPVERALAVLSAVLRPVPLPVEVPLGEDRSRLRRLAEKIDPTSEPALGLLTLTRALWAAGEEALAERLLHAALTARPREVALYHVLGHLLTEQKPPRWREAVECYAAARALRPDLGVSLATALRHSGRARDGLAVLAQLVRESPDNPYLHFKQASALDSQGKPVEAEEACRKAIALKPDYAEAYTGLGVALARQKQNAEAEEACRKAIALKPDLAEAYSNLGGTLAEQGKPVEAEEACRKAIALKPDYTGAYYNLGVVLIRQGKLVDAEVAYHEAIARKPDYADAYNNLGVVLVRQGKLVDAEAAYRKAIALEPDLTEAYTNLGTALYEQRKYAEAEAACRKAIALKPDYTLAYYNLGVVLDGQEKLVDAEAAYRKAIALKPGYAEAYNNLGVVLNRQRKFADAEVAYQKAIVLKPDLAEAYNGLVLLRYVSLASSWRNHKLSGLWMPNS
jgi:serine/threonine-protein kinase